MKTAAHQRYVGANGEPLPSVTTVLGVLGKPGLIKWANNLGLKGIDSTKFRDESAEVGTLAHEMIMCYFSGKECDTKDNTANQIAKAEQSLVLFHKWAGVYNPRPLLVEQHLVSNRYGYGGTIDLYATLSVRGQEFNELCDFKTGSGPWPEHFAQVAAYRQLLIENCYIPDGVRLVKVPANPSIDHFSESQLLTLDKYWILFLHCLAIYKMRIL